MKGRRIKKYSEELKAKVVYDYNVLGLSQDQIAAKYGLSGHGVVGQWIKKSEKACLYGSKSVPLHPETKKDITSMQYSTPQEEIAALKSALEMSNKEKEQYRLQALAYSTMIDIAEEHGYKIRKNSGAKR